MIWRPQTRCAHQRLDTLTELGEVQQDGDRYFVPGS
jgi:hypothetical protein